MLPCLIVIVCLLLFGAIYLSICVKKLHAENVVKYKLETMENEHEEGENNPPEFKEVLQWYNADYCIIAGQIENARNLNHLERMEDEIKWFYKIYEYCKSAYELDKDYNQLYLLWKQRKAAMGIKIRKFEYNYN